MFVSFIHLLFSPSLQTQLSGMVVVRIYFANDEILGDTIFNFSSTLDLVSFFLDLVQVAVLGFNKSNASRQPACTYALLANFAISISTLTEINLLRAPCTYPRGKTAGYYGAKNQKRRATLTSKTQTIMLPVARPRGIAS